MLGDLAQWMIQLDAQASGAPGSSLDDLSTQDVIIRTFGFLAILLIAGWFARRLRR
jgi:hypothetical protein